MQSMFKRTQQTSAITPSLDQVTPELASLVIKHYVLPLFHSETRKNGLHKKGSAFEDLKLSALLSDELSQIRTLFNEYREQYD